MDETVVIFVDKVVVLDVDIIPSNFDIILDDFSSGVAVEIIPVDKIKLTTTNITCFCNKII